MIDHVSPETGKALQDAGLKWEPAVGDWVFCERINPRVRVIAWLYADAIFVGDQGGLRVDWCLWLPTTGQVLDRLRELVNAVDVETTLCGSARHRWTVTYRPDIYSHWSEAYFGEQLGEAVAAALRAALLAAMKEEVQDG